MDGLGVDFEDFASAQARSIRGAPTVGYVLTSHILRLQAALRGFGTLWLCCKRRDDRFDGCLDTFSGSSSGLWL